jgi:hypothetical protein
LTTYWLNIDKLPSFGKSHKGFGAELQRIDHAARSAASGMRPKPPPMLSNMCRRGRMSKLRLPIEKIVDLDQIDPAVLQQLKRTINAIVQCFQ